MAERAGGAVVTLEVYDHAGSFLGQGSGFFLTDGRIVTNTHVVEGAARVDVFGAEEEFLGSVSHAESLSSRVDVAILPRLGSVPGSLGLASTAPRVGESVVVIGAPMGLSHTVSNGIVSAERRIEGVTLVQITAPISPGSSGGPVLNHEGEVIGVAVSILDGGQAINFAVPARDVRALASSPGGSVPFPSARRTASAERTARTDVEPSSRTVVIGDSREGVLTSTDADLDGRYFRLYDFWGEAGQTLVVELTSSEFDPYLIISDSDGDWILDDGGVGRDSELTVTLPETGVYHIVASSYRVGQTGRYRVTLEEAPGWMMPLDDGWVHLIHHEEGEYHYLPRSLRHVFGDVYEAWVRSVYFEPGSGDLVDAYHDRVLMLLRANCRTGRVGIASIVAYDGERVVESEDVVTIEWSAVPPGSVGESLWEAMCDK